MATRAHTTPAPAGRRRLPVSPATLPTVGKALGRRLPGPASVAPAHILPLPADCARIEALVSHLIDWLDARDAALADMEPDHDGEDSHDAELSEPDDELVARPGFLGFHHRNQAVMSGGPRPHPVVTPAAARPSPAASRRAAPIAAAMPSPASMLALLPGLWDEHHTHDLAALRAARLKDEAAHTLAGVAKERIWERIKATQELILASQPTSLADAAAMLLMAHSEIESWNDDHGGDRAHYAIVALLNHALVAIGFVARASGADLAAGAKNYLTEAQAMIVRGEVAA